MSIIILVGVVAIGLSIFFYFNQQKNQALETVDKYLSEKNLEDNIKSKETVYNSKEGAYMVEVVFLDEPENLYEFFPLDGTVYDIIAVDKDNVEITDKKKAKYIDY